jgi:cobalt-zinc-cadmium efflux system protein
MFVIATLGLIVNLIGMKLLSEGSSNSLNIKGAYLEVFSDMLGSIGVIIASLLIMFKGWEIADPIASIAMGLFILPRTWHLLKQVVHVLLEGTPTHIDIDKVEKELSGVEGVIAVHDIHIWTITSGIDVMTAHVEIADFADGNGILIDIKKVLVSKFNILHSTIQLETDECKESDLINI